MMKTILKSCVLILSFFSIIGCMTSTQSTEQKDDRFELKDLYTYDYNLIEPEHEEDVTEWLHQSRMDDISTHLYSISDDGERYGYEYVLRKGYKDFEITFVYSETYDKGNLHIAGIKGDPDDEAFVRIKYDTDYILGVILSDRLILHDRTALRDHHEYSEKVSNAEEV